jgi:cytidine deaminase
MKHGQITVGEVINKDDLPWQQQLVINFAWRDIRKSYAPHGNGHVAAAFSEFNSKEIFSGVNTNSENRGAFCAERGAVSAWDSGRGIEESEVHGILAIVYRSRTALLLPNHNRPTGNQFLTPCGTCLTFLSSMFGPLSLTILMNDGKLTQRATLRDLYPLATVSELAGAFAVGSISTSEPTSHKILKDLSSCAVFTSNLDYPIAEGDFSKISKQMNQVISRSSIFGHKDLKIVAAKLCLDPSNNEARPFVHRSNQIGSTHSIQALCQSADANRINHPKRVIGLMISIHSSNATDQYQFFTGPERQRIFDIAQLTGYDLPVFISLNGKGYLASTISKLCPEFSSPLQSKSAASKIDLYRNTTRLRLPKK